MICPTIRLIFPMVQKEGFSHIRLEGLPGDQPTSTSSHVIIIELGGHYPEGFQRHLDQTMTVEAFSYFKDTSWQPHNMTDVTAVNLIINFGP